MTAVHGFTGMMLKSLAVDTIGIKVTRQAVKA
jgi:hypothetical protein